MRVDYAALGRALLRVRGERGAALEEVSAATGITASGLSRVERGEITGALDVEHYAALCRFIGVPADRFVRGVPGAVYFPREGAVGFVEALLAQDPELEDEARAALSEMMRVNYLLCAKPPRSRV